MRVGASLKFSSLVLEIGVPEEGAPLPAAAHRRARQSTAGWPLGDLAPQLPIIPNWPLEFNGVRLANGAQMEVRPRVQVAWLAEFVCKHPVARVRAVGGHLQARLVRQLARGLPMQIGAGGGGRGALNFASASSAGSERQPSERAKVALANRRVMHERRRRRRPRDLAAF